MGWRLPSGRQWRRKVLALLARRWKRLPGAWAAVELGTCWRSSCELQPGWYRIRVLVRGEQQRYSLQIRRGREPFAQLFPLRNGVERLRILRVSSARAMPLALEFPFLSGAV